MLEIHRTVGYRDLAQRIRARWEKMKARVVNDAQEGESVVKSGQFAVLDHTNNGQIIEKSDWRDGKPSYETRYIEPELDHFCDNTKAWFELRFRTAENAFSVDLGYEDGSFWARTVKEGFMGSIRKELEEAKPTQNCGCDKEAKMTAIKRILGLGPIQQGGVESRIQIDSRYADLENLLDLNPDPPEEPKVWTIL